MNSRMATLATRLEGLRARVQAFDPEGPSPQGVEDPPEVQELANTQAACQLFTPSSRSAAVQER